MSFERGRHDAYEELVSASLTGDLSADERRRLDEHLDGCATCRATLAAYADQRRIVAGLRHVPPPRDLEGRVRAGIERGERPGTPWWRRPPVIVAGVGGGLAAVAGALLALVLFNGAPDGPPVGQASATPSRAASAPAAPVGSGDPSVPPPASAKPTEAAATPSPTARPTPPAAIGWGTVNYLRWDGTLADSSLTLAGWDPETETTADLLELEPAGRPLTASFSPDSRWLAYQVPIGEKGTNRVVVVELTSGRTYELGETPDGSPFSLVMTWSADSRFLAYTAADVDAGVGPDAWLFSTETRRAIRLTDTEATYAASFAPQRPGPELWVSLAGEVPRSFLVPIDAGTVADLPPLDLRSEDASAVAEDVQGVFQPVLSPSGRHALFWRGSMRGAGEAWEIDAGGMLYLSGEPVEGGPSWSGEPAFPSLPAGRDALGGARLAWSYDSDRFAVWNVDWRGVPQTDAGGGIFPNPRAVYFGSASDRALVDPDGAWINVTGGGELERPVDVAFVGYDLGGDLPSVAVTVFVDPGGESGESPVAEARLVVAPAGGFGGPTPEVDPDGDWVGPALYVPQGNEGR